MVAEKERAELARKVEAAAKAAKEGDLVELALQKAAEKKQAEEKKAREEAEPLHTPDFAIMRVQLYNLIEEYKKFLLADIQDTLNINRHRDRLNDNDRLIEYIAQIKYLTDNDVLSKTTRGG